jgi:uncharacterized membrane protein HdeD (DUF308 family)
MSKIAARQFFTTMWLTVLVRGVASLVFGILAFTYPGITLNVLVTVFGIYAVIDGLAALWGEFRGKGGGTAALLHGLGSFAAGIFCLVFPGTAALYVVLLIGFWNVAVGLLQIAGAFVLRNEMSNAVLLGLGGLLSALLGLLIVLYPAGGAVSIIWIIAGTAIVVGLVLIVFALKLRRAGLELFR